MKIKNIFAATALALLTGGCANEPAPGSPAEGTPMGITLSVSSAEMTMAPDTRATAPMSPDEEKLIHSMAIFEFDNEGLHVKDNYTYHYVDFIKGTISGATYGETIIEPTEFGITETRLTGIAFRRYTNGTLCLVGNVTEQQVEELYNNYKEEGQSYGRITFDKFQEWNIPMEYYNPTESEYKEERTGHLTNMSSFGYFQGEIGKIKEFNEDGTAKSYEIIDVDLGRIASRIDLTIVNETGHDIEKRLAYHFDNVCVRAYVFPGSQGFDPDDATSRARTVICAGYKYNKETKEWEYKTDENGNIVLDEQGNKIRVRDDVPLDVKKIIQTVFKNGDTHTRYFYVAGHSAAKEDEATKLHLYYDRVIYAGDGTPDKNEKDPTNSVLIPLCNVTPSEAGDVPDGKGYTLSRNTRYHFTIRIKKSSIPDNPPYTPGTEPDTGSGSDTPGIRSADSPRITYETTGPNEISVYL